MSDLPQAATGQESPQVARPARARRGRRFLRWAALAVVILTCAYLARAPVLRCVARGLISDDPDFRATHAVILGREYHFAAIDSLRRSGRVQEVLVVVLNQSRLESAGVLRPFGERARDALTQRSWPPSAVHVIHGAGNGQWDRVRLLQGWLRANPTATVAVLSDRFGSRTRRRVLESVLTPDEMARVAIHAPPDSLFSEDDWWQVKYGWLNLFNGYVGLIFVYVQGESSEPWRDWDPDAYTQALRQEVGK